jgi:hypothetical protein
VEAAAAIPIATKLMTAIAMAISNPNIFFSNLEL